MSFHNQLKYKIASKEIIKDRLSDPSFNSKKIVFTNGCFDILHPGHVDYLAKARDLGDFLIIGLNTDNSVRSLEKAPGRPVNNENARSLVLAGLACVDAVIYFDEPTPFELISYIQPDILVKGGDYTPEKIVGYDVVTKKGGQVISLPFLEGYSTTSIIKKITGI
jgi:D-glycero-beta-D-manno-heptose 1-phosphate adenylyltransferase